MPDERRSSHTAFLDDGEQDNVLPPSVSSLNLLRTVLTAIANCSYSAPNRRMSKASIRVNYTEYLVVGTR